MNKYRVLMLVFATAPAQMLGMFQWVWEALAIASSLFSGVTARNAAKGAESAAKNQFEFNQRLYDEYKQKYGPLEDSILAGLRTPIDESAEYRGGRAAIERSIGTADAALRRRFAGGAGTNLENAYRQSNQLSRAGATADLYGNLSAQRKTQELNALATGKGLPGAATNLANVYNTRTNIAGANAAAAGQGFADLAGNLSLLYLLNKPGGSQKPDITNSNDLVYHNDFANPDDRGGWRQG